MGGISGLSLGLRGSRVQPDTDTTHQQALWDAIARVYAANSNTIAQDYMNNLVGGFFSDETLYQIVMRSNEVAWPGSKLIIINGWYAIQLVNKMDRISRKRANNNGRYKPKDGQDAVAFLKKCVKNNGNRNLKMDQMTLFSYLIGKDVTTLIQATAGVLQSSYAGFADEVMEVASANNDQ